MSELQNPFAASTPLDNSVAESDIPRLEPPQSVRFAQTAESIAAFWSHRTHSSASDKRTRRNNMLIGLTMVIAAPLVLIIAAYQGMVPYWIGIPALGFTVLMVWWFAKSIQRTTIDTAYLLEVRRIMDESPNEQLRGERSLTLEASGVREILLFGDSFTRWEAYEHIEHTDHHAFFYESSMTAVVVPRNAFASQSQFLGFVRLAQRLWQEHRENSNADQPSPKADAV